MIELSHEQVTALLGFIGNTRALLSRMETAHGPTAGIRDVTLDDCSQWRDLLLRKLDARRPSPQPGEPK